MPTEALTRRARRAARPGPGPTAAPGLSARDRAYQDLRHRILTGRLAPGTTLLETELAALLGLSRTPVREATIKLAEEGLIDIRPRHGITVRTVSPEDVRDILDVFSALEIRAVELVARRGLTDEELAHLQQMLSRMERLTAAGDIARWSDMDDDLHSTIVALCGNPRLLRTLGEYWGQQYRARLLILPLRPAPVQSDLEHRAMLAAIAARDVEAARRTHQQHRDRADAQQVELLRARLGSGAA
ncbi:GntR family transcriptional regulator [uncultured Paracoccus sp.]|uniref:GntR family transcriptional regulator n=1 Tax=uncultured Paracoccus sp. TaxID=189685 RepID=UPI00261F6FDF|nr:GntR family transcriptional regulator [uncultured Paracoccus sp.]